MTEERATLDAVREVAARLYARKGDIRDAGLNAVHREVGGSKATVQKHLAIVHDELIGAPRVRDNIPLALRAKGDELVAAIFRDAQLEAERAFLDRSQSLADLSGTYKADLEIAVADLERLEEATAKLQLELGDALSTSNELDKQLKASEGNLAVEKPEHAKTLSLLEQERSAAAALRLELDRLEAGANKMDRIETMLSEALERAKGKPAQSRK